MSQKLNAFPYIGGKYSHLKWLLPQLDTPHKTYCEPFAGSLAVLLNKPRARREVAGDLNREAITFWRCMRDEPRKLIRAIYLTPGGSGAFEECFMPLPEGAGDIEIARRFYVKLTMGFGGLPIPNSINGYGFANAVGFNSRKKRLRAVAERIAGVMFEVLPAARVIKSVSNYKRGYPVLFYLDPPYTMDSRSGGVCYAVDPTGDEGVKMHVELLDTVEAVIQKRGAGNAKFAISGYANPLYDDRLTAEKGWRRVEVKVAAGSANKAGVAGRRTEVLWRNYAIAGDEAQGRLL